MMMQSYPNRMSPISCSFCLTKEMGSPPLASRSDYWATRSIHAIPSNPRFCKTPGLCFFGFLFSLSPFLLLLAPGASCMSRIRTVLFSPCAPRLQGNPKQTWGRGAAPQTTSLTPPLTCWPPGWPRTRVLSRSCQVSSSPPKR